LEVNMPDKNSDFRSVWIDELTKMPPMWIPKTLKSKEWKLCQDCPFRRKWRCSLGYTISQMKSLGDKKPIKISKDCKLKAIITEDRVYSPKTTQCNWLVVRGSR
jgi:hypothetical protein